MISYRITNSILFVIWFAPAFYFTYNVATNSNYLSTFTKIECVKQNSTILNANNENDQVLSYYKCPHGQVVSFITDCVPDIRKEYWERNGEISNNPWPGKGGSISSLVICFVLALPLFIIFMFIFRKLDLDYRKAVAKSRQIVPQSTQVV